MIAKAGISLTNFLTPYIYSESDSLGSAFMPGVVLAIVGLILCLVFNTVDKFYEERMEAELRMKRDMRRIGEDRS